MFWMSRCKPMRGLKSTAMDDQVPSGKRVRRKRFTAMQASRRLVAFETPTTPPCPNSPSVAYLS